MSKKRKRTKRKSNPNYKQSQRQKAQTTLRKRVGNRHYFTKSDLSKEDTNVIIEIKSGDKWVTLGRLGDIIHSRIIKKLKEKSEFSGKYSEQNKKKFDKKFKKILESEKSLDDISDKIEEIKSRPEPTSSIYNPQIGKSLHERVQEFIAQMNESGELEAVESKYGFLYELQSKYGLDREKQAEINEIFKQANDKLLQIKLEFDIDLGREFQLYKSNSLEQINGKIEAAKKVLEMNYLQKKAHEYKIDYITEFSLMLEDKDAEEFQEAMDLVTDTQFLKILKETGFDYMVYAFESMVKDYGYNEAWARVKILIDAIYKAKGIKKEVKGETHGLS